MKLLRCVNIIIAKKINDEHELVLKLMVFKIKKIGIKNIFAIYCIQ